MDNYHDADTDVEIKDPRKEFLRETTLKLVKLIKFELISIYSE